MTDLPEILTFVRIEDGTFFTACGEARYTLMTELLEAYPALTDPGNETVLARLVTHFAKGQAFRVVSDPKAFEAAYRAALAADDPTKPWRQDSPRRPRRPGGAEDAPAARDSVPWRTARLSFDS